MKISDIRICILRIEGTNCEQEMHDCFARLGAKPELVHLNQCNENLFEYQCLVIPGGFSTGDYVRAGAIFASLIKSKLARELRKYISDEYPVLGVCNGFQILVELGLLPGLSKKVEACLATNRSARFECRPTLLRHENHGNCVFTKGIKTGKVLMIPSAHAEGRFCFPKDEEANYLKKLIENDQIVFRYVNPRGEYAGYPWNPNGSFYNIAGICNPAGNVLGLMPHPERVFYAWQHPNWRKRRAKDNRGDGRALFENILAYLKRRF